MRPVEILLCVACVLLVSIGQVLLRAASLAAKASSQTGIQSWLSARSLVAIAVYGCAMLLWLWLLTRVPLTQAFAFFGISFFLVPLLANRFLGDPVNVYTWLGAGVIALGIMISSWKAS